MSKRILYLNIPHKVIYQYDIKYTPLHMWEHLFVRYLQRDKRVDFVAGKTTTYQTTLCIEVSGRESISLDYIVRKIRRSRLTNQDLTKEMLIINNELECLKFLNISVDPEHKKFLNDSFKYDALLWVKKNGYEWDKAYFGSIYSQVGSTTKAKVSSQNYIALIRNIMINWTAQTAMNPMPVTTQDRAFVLYIYTPKLRHAEETNQWHKYLSNIDGKNGFLESKLVRKYALSFFFWPSFDNGSFYLYTFMEINKIYYVWQLIVDWLCSYGLRNRSDQSNQLRSELNSVSAYIYNGAEVCKYI